MQNHIHVHEAIHNAARSLREDQCRGYISDAHKAKANMTCAIRREHEQAAAFWAEVIKFCKARDRSGPGMAIIIKPYPIG